MTVYLDQVWLLNTLLDYLLLVVSARFCGQQIHRFRFLLVAVLGGGYAAAGFIWPLLHGMVARFLSGILLGWCAYGRKWKVISVFFLLSAAMAGIVMALGNSTGNIAWPALLLSSGVFMLLGEVVFRQSFRFGRSNYKAVRVRVEDKECVVRALHDTGNTLRSPINGAAVLVSEIRALDSLWSRDEASILHSDSPPQEKVAHLYALGNKRFSLLPYTSVGGSGLLLCMRSDAVTVGRNVYRRAPVALVQHALGSNYDALWGGEEETNALAAVHTRMDTAG